MAKRSLNDLRDEMKAVAKGERAPTPLENAIASQPFISVPYGVPNRGKSWMPTFAIFQQELDSK